MDTKLMYPHSRMIGHYLGNVEMHTPDDSVIPFRKNTLRETDVCKLGEIFNNIYNSTMLVFILAQN